MVDRQALFVRDYLRGASRLYGRISLMSLHSLLLQHGVQASSSVFCRLAMQAQGPEEPFRIIGDDDIYDADISFSDMDRWLVHRQYCYAIWDPLFTLEKNQEGKPLRVFSLQEILMHADPTYFPPTPEIKELCTALLEYSDGSVFGIDILRQAYALAENDYDAPGFLAEMQRLGCRFASLEDRQRLAQCYKAVFDTVPKAVHKGHSEREMLADPHVEKPLKRYYLWFCPPKEDDGFRLDSPRLAEVLPSTGVTERQRFLERCLQSQTLPTRLFDPCPCGSGLYYADCCGKR